MDNQRCSAYLKGSPYLRPVLIRGNTVIELFVRGRKLNISLAFITQSYFAVQTNVKLNSTN